MHSHSARSSLFLPLRTTKEQKEEGDRRAWGARVRPASGGRVCHKVAFYRSRRGHGRAQGRWLLVAARSPGGSRSSVPPRALPRTAPGRVPQSRPCCLLGTQNKERARTPLRTLRWSQAAAICGRRIWEQPWRAPACVLQVGLLWHVQRMLPHWRAWEVVVEVGGQGGASPPSAATRP